MTAGAWEVVGEKLTGSVVKGDLCARQTGEPGGETVRELQSGCLFSGLPTKGQSSRRTSLGPPAVFIKSAIYEKIKVK